MTIILATELYVIALLAFWTVISANEVLEWELQCPVTKCSCPEKYATNLPHETDCTKFYKCSWCSPVVQDCPIYEKLGNKRLHYNRKLQVCDWPWQAGCENCTKLEDDKCSYENEKISNPDDNCRTYFECVDGKPKYRTCPSGTCFSRTCQACVKNRKGGKCDDRPTGGCREGDRKCHDCNCRQYYECKRIKDNGLQWINESCDGLFYNPENKKCESAIGALKKCRKVCLKQEEYWFAPMFRAMDLSDASQDQIEKQLLHSRLLTKSLYKIKCLA